MRFADSIDATAISLTPAVRVSGARSSFAATTTLSHLAGAWSNSATLNGSLTSDRSRRLSWELEGLAGGSSHSDGARTAQLLAFGRGHLRAETSGAWLGAGLGAASDVEWRDVRQLDAGVWLSLPTWDLVGRASPTAVDDSIRYTDLLFSAHHANAQWELDASLGIRAGDPIPTLPDDRKTWGSAAIAFRLTSRVAVVGSAGAYPVDFTQGYPGGRYVSLSLRFSSRNNLDVTASPSRRDGLREFRVDRIAAGRYRVRVRATSASSVELAADFTRWTPVVLARDSEQWWSMTVDLAEGTHEVAVRINGGPWEPPPGLTPLTDEFGGRSGLLVIAQ